VRQGDDLEAAVVGLTLSLSVAYFAICAMLANRRLSKRCCRPSSSSMVNGRNRAKVRTTDTISRSEPLPPFSRSIATMGVSPIPM